MKKLFCSFLILAFLMPASVSAQSVTELIDRMDKLDEALKSVQRKLSNNYVGSKKTENVAASEGNLDAMVMRLQEMEQSLQTMTGELETIKFNQDKLSERMDKMNADYGLRFKESEEKLLKSQEEIKKLTDEKKRLENEKEAAAKKQKAKEAAAAKAEKDREAKIKAQYGKMAPQVLYDKAFASMKKSDYKAAEGQFEAFLALHPKHDLAGNAQYWLGESYYARSQYDKAAVAFADGFKNYRQSQKAPDNLLKLGLTMARLNKKKEACIAFQNFSREYPKVSDAMKKRLENEAKKLGCR